MEGTVIEGTLRSDHLIRAFWRELLSRDYDAAMSIFKRDFNVFQYIDDHGGLDGASASLLDAAAWTVSDLVDALDESAPQGYYFGAHPGDGSDFGYWPIEEEEEEPCPDDYILSSTGRLGSKTQVSQGERVLGVFDSHNDAEQFIATHMEATKFWPNVWILSDHGNYHLTTLD